MDFTNGMNTAQAYRQGQRDGLIAGMIVSVGVYYLWRAYRPANPFRFAKEQEDQQR